MGARDGTPRTDVLHEFDGDKNRGEHTDEETDDGTERGIVPIDSSTKVPSHRSDSQSAYRHNVDVLSKVVPHSSPQHLSLSADEPTKGVRTLIKTSSGHHHITAVVIDDDPDFDDD